MVRIFLVFLFFTLSNSCNMANSDKRKGADALQTDHPMAKRKTIHSFKRQEGDIVLIDGTNMGIQTKDSVVLLPINLPASMKKAGVHVLFSADAKETGPAELWAAQPVILTEISRN